MLRRAFRSVLWVFLCGALAVPVQSQDSGSPDSGTSDSNFGFSLPVTASGAAMYTRRGQSDDPGSSPVMGGFRSSCPRRSRSGGTGSSTPPRSCTSRPIFTTTPTNRIMSGTFKRSRLSWATRFAARRSRWYSRPATWRPPLGRFPYTMTTPTTRCSINRSATPSTWACETISCLAGWPTCSGKTPSWSRTIVAGRPVLTTE